MRWLAVHPGPAFSVHDTFIGWTEALRELGETVKDYALNDVLTFYDHILFEATPGAFYKPLTSQQATELAVDRLCCTLWKFRPDVLFIVSGFFIDHAVLTQVRRDGTKVVVLTTEEPYEHDRHLALAPHVDLLLADDPTNLEALQALTRAVYMPKAFRPAVHQCGPADPMLTSDFSFVGTGYPSRIQFLEAMNLAGLDVLLAGNWQQLADDSPLRQYLTGDLGDCLDNERAADVYRSTQVGINLYRREAERPELSAGWSMGPRELELAACGSFFLRDPRGEGDEVLGMLPTFLGPDDASELLRWWLAHPDLRAELAVKAAAAVQDRTFTANAARLLRLMERT